MTKKDLFRVAIKLLAFMSLFQFSLAFIGSILSISQDFNQLTFSYLLEYLALQSVIIIGLIVLLFYTDFFINLLKLDEGFDEDYIYLEEINAAGIAKVSMIIAGIVIFVNTIPELIQNVIISLRAENTINYSVETVTDFDWISSIFKMAAAYLLIANYNWLIRVLNIEEKIETEEKDTGILDENMVNE